MGLFIFNPFGVVALLCPTPGFTWGYSYSTPSGLWPLFVFPRFHLGLFLFNPFGVVAPLCLPQVSPQCHIVSHPKVVP